MLDLQANFYYEILFVVIILFISFFLSKTIRSMLAQRVIKPTSKMKVICLGVYIRLEPYLFYYISIILLSILYFVDYFAFYNHIATFVAQIIVVILLISKIIRKFN